MTLSSTANLIAFTPPVPRYRFRTGQQFTYRLLTAPNHLRGGNAPAENGRTEVEWTITVVRHNDDRTWTLHFLQTLCKTTGATSDVAGMQCVQADGYFEIDVTGELIENETIGPDANPTVLFPKLPPEHWAPSDLWSSTLRVDETKRTFRLHDGSFQSPDNLVVFVENTKTFFDSVYLLARRRMLTFDFEKGIVVHVTTDCSRGWPDGGRPFHTRETIELTALTLIAADELAALDREFGSYLAARRQYDNCVANGLFDSRRAAYWLDRAEGALSGPPLTSSMLTAIVKGKLQLLREERPYLLADAAKWAELLGAAAAQWTALDLDGITHAILDHRGSVTVLIFCYRGCSWCMRLLPQFAELAEHFADARVVFFAVSLDARIEDARFIASHFRLSTPILRASAPIENLMAACGLRGCPATIIIDGAGNVQAIWSGYSPRWAGDAAAAIRAILDNSTFHRSFPP